MAPPVAGVRDVATPEALERPPRRPDEALCRLRAGEQVAGEGWRSEADEQFERALAFYRSVGATRYIRKGDTLLGLSAARPWSERVAMSTGRGPSAAHSWRTLIGPRN